MPNTESLNRSILTSGQTNSTPNSASISYGDSLNASLQVFNKSLQNHVDYNF
jgi:hypothetical protein